MHLPPPFPTPNTMLQAPTTTTRTRPVRRTPAQPAPKAVPVLSQEEMLSTAATVSPPQYGCLLQLQTLPSLPASLPMLCKFRLQALRMILSCMPSSPPLPTPNKSLWGGGGGRGSHSGNPFQYHVEAVLYTQRPPCRCMLCNTACKSTL